MLAVDVLETSEDFDDDDETDEDDDEAAEDNGGLGNGHTLELSKLLDVSVKRGVFDEPDEENDFEDPDARLLLF
jgi:hypothetical protein